MASGPPRRSQPAKFASCLPTSALSSGTGASRKARWSARTDLLGSNQDAEEKRPHQALANALAEGDLYDSIVTCPWHGSEFDVETGEAVTPPAIEPEPVYEVRVEGDEIQVANPAS
jgi:Rieske 2Fe-2S protein